MIKITTRKLDAAGNKRLVISSDKANASVEIKETLDGHILIKVNAWHSGSTTVERRSTYDDAVISIKGGA